MATRTGIRRAETARRAKRVLLAGDRFLIIEGVRLALAGRRYEIAMTGTGQQALATAIGAFAPTVIVIDLSHTDIERSIRTVRQFAGADRSLITLVSDKVSVDAARLVGAGAACVLGLDSPLDEVVGAIERIIAGSPPMTLEHRYELEELMRGYRSGEAQRWLPFDELTAREREIFRLVYDGLSADQIADQACVSVNTVRSHIRSILAKLNVNSQLAAVAMARTQLWFDAGAAGA